ncbi:hypothetical protein MVI01_58960 [Myxococcus virescens]|uniref:Uncharacterized protein n=1 Tax=Myxococcus virescens TaxID=83456 RepID=A0A511HKL6_9BACT|nr:hypothetical protein MVI01_58960 [Myxococcus virescens]
MDEFALSTPGAKTSLTPMTDFDNPGRWLIAQAVRMLMADWSSRDERRRPWGTWVLLWGAIESDEELERLRIAVPLLGAWFLSDSCFVRHDVWRYLRHRSMQHSSLYSPLATRVGVLEVAPYRREPAVYAASHCGPRDAYGVRLERDSSGQLTEHRIWVA